MHIYCLLMFDIYDLFILCSILNSSLATVSALTGPMIMNFI